MGGDCELELVESEPEGVEDEEKGLRCGMLIEEDILRVE